MKQKPLTTHSYIRCGDELIDFDELSPEEKKKVSQALNEQAARTIVLTTEEATA